MQFIFNNFCYSVLDEEKLTVVVGNTSSSSIPNAVYSKYTPNIIIPQFIYHENKKYEVVEVAKNAFDGCDVTKHVTIPSSIIVIRRGAFHEMTNVETFEIKGGGRLTIIEKYAFARMYKLKTLVLPSSLVNLTQQCLACMTNLTHLYYCSSIEVSEDVFRDFLEESITNLNLKIHVPRTYNGTMFGNRTNLVFDDFLQKCFFSFDNTCKIRNNRMGISQLFLILISIS